MNPQILQKGLWQAKEGIDEGPYALRGPEEASNTVDEQVLASVGHSKEDCRPPGRIRNTTGTAGCGIGGIFHKEEIGTAYGPSFELGSESRKIFLRLGNGLVCPLIRPGDITLYKSADCIK